MVSPFTLKVPLLISVSVREYKLATNCCRNFVLGIAWSTSIEIIFFLNSTGFPIP